VKLLRLYPETVSPITQALYQREPHDWELHGLGLDDLLATAGKEIAKLRSEQMLARDAGDAHKQEAA